MQLGIASSPGNLGFYNNWCCFRIVDTDEAHLVCCRFEDQQGLDKLLGDLFDLFDADKVCHYLILRIL
jgi:hypothetical protein